MNKKLLIGLGVGLVAYYFLMKKGKGKCNCQEAIQVEPTAETPEDKMCREHAQKLASTMRFASPEASKAWFDDTIAGCKKNGIKKAGIK